MDTGAVSERAKTAKCNLKTNLKKKPDQNCKRSEKYSGNLHKKLFGIKIEKAIS